MSRKHLTWHIEAYLDQALSDEDRRFVVEHIHACSTCARRLTEAQRLAAELGPTLQGTLGRPQPPAALRQRVRQALRLKQPHAKRRPAMNWAGPGQWLSTVGTLAVIILLAVGVFTLVRSQLPATPNPSAPQLTADVGEQVSRPTITSASVSATSPATTATFAPESPPPDDASSSPTSGPTDAVNPQTPALAAALTPTEPTSTPTVATTAPSPLPLPTGSSTKPLATPPGGTIAFAFFNPAPQRRVFEIHLIDPDGTNHRLFPLDGVSEPALSADGRRLVYRAWSEPTGPRSLLSSDLGGEGLNLIGGFWEDAHPDWSPSGDRLVFASQREMDRRWRLYTSRADGSAEVNLGLEGKAPTFATDGRHLAYEGCDLSGNRCGLWLADVGSAPSDETAQESATVLLADPLAHSPDWSPVADQIAYMANPGGNWDLYLASSDGSQVRRLTDDPAIDGLPAWSPDGEWLAFLSDRGGDWGIWLLHVARGELRQVYAFDGGTFTPPVRSPYGERRWWDEQISWGR